jgi:hypothetical protein
MSESNSSPTAVITHQAHVIISTSSYASSHGWGQKRVSFLLNSSNILLRLRTQHSKGKRGRDAVPKSWTRYSNDKPSVHFFSVSNSRDVSGVAYDDDEKALKAVAVSAIYGRVDSGTYTNASISELGLLDSFDTRQDEVDRLQEQFDVEAAVLMQRRRLHGPTERPQPLGIDVCAVISVAWDILGHPSRLFNGRAHNYRPLDP